MSYLSLAIFEVRIKFCVFLKIGCSQLAVVMFVSHYFCLVFELFQQSV